MNKGKGEEKEKVASYVGNSCCPQSAWQNITALYTLHNYIKAHWSLMVLVREFHQIGARTKKALALVKNSWT